MKIMKWSSILLLSVFFMWAFMPQAHAKRHYRNRSSFGLSFNFAPAPNYVVAPAPAPVVAPAPVAVVPYGAYYPTPVYYSTPMVAPAPGPNVYVQPGYSYSYWRY